MEMSVDHLIKGVKGFENKNVTITGGEPFMQADPLFFLFKELMIEGYRISVETNGSISFAPLEHIDYVVDYKMPSSGEFERMNRYTPFLDLKPTDWIKFVIQTTDDYQMAIQEMRWLKSEGCDAQFAMSPILNTFPINSFLNRLQMGNVSDVVVSVQLHKLLKLDEAP
jgi:7-carboxy-7-deazaguanine synthase